MRGELRPIPKIFAQLLPRFVPGSRYIHASCAVFSDKPPLRIDELAKLFPPPKTSRGGEWSPSIDGEGKSVDDTLSASAASPTDQKDELIFKDIMSHVLLSPDRKNESKSNSKSSTPLADSILALFDRAGPESNERSKRTSKTGELMTGLLSPKSAPSVSAEQIKRSEAIKAKLSLVLQHIDELPTNKDVIHYFKMVIIPRFDPAHTLDYENPGEPFDPLEIVPGSETTAPVLERCVTVLAQEFKDPLGALHLFELSKRHSIDFFSEACSAEVYNQIIRIRWYDYRDLYAVVNLTAEISINAIPPTLETTELLAKIYREGFDSAKGMSSSPYGMPLWSGQDARRLEILNRYRRRFQASWAAKPILRF